MADKRFGDSRFGVHLAPYSTIRDAKCAAPRAFADAQPDPHPDAV